MRKEGDQGKGGWADNSETETEQERCNQVYVGLTCDQG